MRGLVALWCVLAPAVPLRAQPLISVSENLATVARYDVYEIAIQEGGSYANPWEDVAVNATFTAPSGARFQAGGFYYDTALWKVRFAPNAIGKWTWSLTFRNSGGASTAVGSFNVVASSNRGFLRLHPSNPYRLITDGDQRPFYPVGLADAVVGYYTMDGSGANVGIDKYFDTYAAAGNNIFRVLVNGGNSPVLQHALNVNGTGKNLYSIDDGKAMDTVIEKLHQDRYQIFMTIWGGPPNFGELSGAGVKNSVLSYHKYVMDRYGAYVSIWELMNEQTAPKAYYDTVIPYVRGYDPYHHLLSTSDPQPALGLDVDITSPHRYFNAYNASLGGLDPAAGYLADDIAQWKSAIPNKPVLYGEAGIQSPYNYDPLGYRLWLWTAFFNEAGLIFWNTSYKTTYTTNQYIGPKERGFSQAFSGLVADFDPVAKPVKVTVSPSSEIHAYALASAADAGVYLLAWNFNTTVSGATLNVTIPSDQMTGQWIDPSTGTVIRAFTAHAGQQTLKIPDFKVDLLLRLRGAGCVDPPGIPGGFAAPCPVLRATPAAITATAPAGVLAFVLPTFFVFDSGQWLAVPVPGTTGWCFRACSAAVPSLAPGIHGVASWDWSWNGSCWVGPGSNTCGQGNWRYQTLAIP